MNEAGRPLVGARSGPWCELLERVTRELRPGTAYAVRALLMTLCERPEDFTPAQLTAAGKAARRLLEYAWRATSRDPWLVSHALQAVCRTFESDPVVSAILLRRALAREHLAEHGFEELPWLAREVKRLIRLDPAFVEEIYRAASGHREPSEAPTAMLASSILPMTSTRRQDYGMALYELAEAFPEFLAQAPVAGLRALIAVLEAYVAERHPVRVGEAAEEVFDFRGRDAKVRTDYSAIWDVGRAYRHDEPLRMLDALDAQLERIVGGDSIAALRELVDVVVDSNRLAVLWTRLLRLGARFPDTFGPEILPLAWAPPILTGFDTSTAAGEFLRAVFPQVSADDRERIERAILALPDRHPADERDEGEETQDRLLGCLAEDRLVTDQARARVAALRAAGTVPPNEPPVEFKFTRAAYTEEADLARHGVPVDAEANRRLRELEQPVKDFADRHLNSVPTPDEVAGVLPALEALQAALSRADADGVDSRQRDYAWGHLAASCARVARLRPLSCADRMGGVARAVLLEASHQERPVPTSPPARV